MSLMKVLFRATLFLTLILAAAPAHAQVNAGTLKPEAEQPFVMNQVATFNLPWRIAFLPDGRMVITEKVGPVYVVGQDGTKTVIANTPAVLASGQGGMLGVFLSPTYAKTQHIYLTYSEPGETGPDGRIRDSSLALARAKLVITK